ncbi:uncharacterized protein LOC131856997 [Cryptomeria japonica]|uniref:uncharacterized protein LOC131856997 n=1 Tax=Cryptomeria japonica TaxID=3369 RepID=UPI0027D9F256|nr:uncharacterized protein LOC131856997 [Cryptomeria japonica]
MVRKEPSLGRLKTLVKVEQLADMLNRHGCTEDQIAKIIRLRPTLTTVSAERVLEPKIKVLIDLGMETENIAKIVVRHTAILTSKQEILRSNSDFLRTVFQTKDFLITAIMRSPSILCLKALKPSVAFWEGFGFRGIELIKFLLFNPRVLTYSSLTPEQLDLIRKIGIQKEKKMYKYVVSMVANNRIEVLQVKIDNLQLCGLSPEEAWEIVRAEPSVLTKSEENVKKKMNFMFNHMQLSVNYVTKHPRMFTMSLDKVMRPRFLVLQSMTAMNGAGQVNPRGLLTILMMTQAKFVARIIQAHPEYAALWTVYKNALANVSKSPKVKWRY